MDVLNEVKRIAAPLSSTHIISLFTVYNTNGFLK
jgi:hypothetical protein